MEEIRPINPRDEESLATLLSIWESSVRQTHTFLSEQDILEIKTDVTPALLSIEHLYACCTSTQISGFIGVEQNKIEMLFIDASARGRGTGKKLLTYALKNLNARFVDVNEQNTQAVGFYQHMGFSQTSRSELDSQGRPFPLLHLKHQ